MKSPINLASHRIYPIHCDEEEKAAKVVTKNTDENKVNHQLTGEPRI